MGSDDYGELDIEISRSSIEDALDRYKDKGLDSLDRQFGYGSYGGYGRDNEDEDEDGKS